ncbi:MAG: ATP-binding protein [Actinomycetota bacterium]
MSSTVRSFPADPSVLVDIRRFLKEQAGRAGMDRGTTDDLLVVANEACTNAIQHSGTDSIEVTWTGTEEGTEIDIRDGGVFKRRIRVSELEGPGGYGIPLMTALSDELEIREGTPSTPGTHVRFRLRRQG